MAIKNVPRSLITLRKEALRYVVIVDRMTRVTNRLTGTKDLVLKRCVVVFTEMTLTKSFIAIPEPSP